MIGDDQRIFWGLKFSVLGFFGGRKIWQVFFGCLDLSRDFWGIKTICNLGCSIVPREVSFIALLLKQQYSSVLRCLECS